MIQGTPAHPWGKLSVNLWVAPPWGWLSSANSEDAAAVSGALQKGLVGLPPHTCNWTQYGTHTGLGGAALACICELVTALGPLSENISLPGPGVRPWLVLPFCLGYFAGLSAYG